jgi:hypothetical protein
MTRSQKRLTKFVNPVHCQSDVLVVFFLFFMRFSFDLASRDFYCRFSFQNIFCYFRVSLLEGFL